MREKVNVTVTAKITMTRYQEMASLIPKGMKESEWIRSAIVNYIEFLKRESK